MCRSDGAFTVSGRSHSEGMISSISAYNNRRGSRICPWIIEADPGQKINVSIMDFGLFENDGPSMGGNSVVCHKYAMLIDGGGTQPPKTVCSSYPRERNAYISHTNILEIRFVDVQGSDTPPNFLLKYSGTRKISFDTTIVIRWFSTLSLLSTTY